MSLMVMCRIHQTGLASIVWRPVLLLLLPLHSSAADCNVGICIIIVAVVVTADKHRHDYGEEDVCHRYRQTDIGLSLADVQRKEHVVRHRSGCVE